MDEDDRMETDPTDSTVITLPNVATIRSDLAQSVAELSFRGLCSSAQWAAELCAALPPDGSDVFFPPALSSSSAGSSKMHSSLMLAKTCFDMREYSRAAHSLQDIKDLHTNQAALFLRFYSLYLAGEKRKEEEVMEISDPVEKCQVKNVELSRIEEHLSLLYKNNQLDGLNMYLYGITLRGLELKAEARQVLIKSVHAFPCNWSAWLDIIGICSELNDVSDPQAAAQEADLDLPDHWMSWFSKAALHMELQRNEEAQDVYSALQSYFPNSSYILSQVAICYYNMRNFDSSQVAFDEVRKKDPYKLASLDTYSNILYVKEQSAALSHLARQAVKIDKYTPEACCIIGNYYSLKGEHEKSVTYFQRALCLNRNFTPAWILMGHEFMEMKNTPAAIDAYRTAVNINQRDYRAWYGLGQTYELLSLHFYALFYYRKAMTLRPGDARMWCAMAGCYESMDRKSEALKCYEKAHRCGDCEGMALPRLARLHHDLGNRKQAASCYEQLLMQLAPGSRSSKVPASGLSAEAVEALKFMMQFYKEEGNVVKCELCATQLLDTGGPEKDEAKAILRDLRTLDSRPPFQVGQQIVPEALAPQRFPGAMS
jgi:anaphase-promoting complex subunit 8